MAERTSSSAPWLAFLAGMVLIALIVVGFVYFKRTVSPTATNIEVELPDIEVPPPPELNPPKIEPPEIAPPPIEQVPAQ